MELLSVEGNMSHYSLRRDQNHRFRAGFRRTGRPERRTFQTRPKIDGLWVSLQFRDGETLEGIMPNNLLQVEHYGFTIVPPDSSSNQQRMFAPREALWTVEVLAWWAVR